jgi:hypothetical protein
MWKEAVVAYFEVGNVNLPERTEKHHEKPVRVAGLRADI